MACALPSLWLAGKGVSFARPVMLLDTAVSAMSKATEQTDVSDRFVTTCAA